MRQNFCIIVLFFLSIFIVRMFCTQSFVGKRIFQRFCISEKIEDVIDSLIISDVVVALSLCQFDRRSKRKFV